MRTTKMARLVITGLVLLLGVSVSGREILGTSPAPGSKPSQVPPKATTPMMKPSTANNKPAGNKPTPKPMPRTSAPGGKAANVTGSGARNGIGKFEYIDPLQPPLQSYPGADFGHRRLLGASPKPTMTPKAKPGAQPAGKPTGKPAGNKPTPKPMPGGKAANATGSGARSGIGKFEYMAPLQPPLQSYPGADFGHRRLLGASPKPTMTPKAKPGAQPAGKPAGNKSTPKPMPRTSAPGGKPGATAGSGARNGIGKFEYTAPLQPPLQSYPGADFGHRRLLGASPKPTMTPQGKPGAQPAGKPAGNKSTPKPMPRTSAPGGKPGATAGSGARNGIGKFEYTAPLQPPLQSYPGADFGH